jgi:uncharacterized protein
VSNIKEHRNGTSAAVKYDEISCLIFHQWMKILKIPSPIDAKDLHTTIIYSRTPIPESAQHSMDDEELKRKRWRFSPKSIELFSGTDEQALVMLLEAPELVEIHNELIKAGATHDFPEYNPHITLSYNVPVDYDYKSIILPPMHFFPSKIIFESLDINWQSDD